MSEERTLALGRHTNDRRLCEGKISFVLLFHLGLGVVAAA